MKIFVNLGVTVYNVVGESHDRLAEWSLDHTFFEIINNREQGFKSVNRLMP
jgi:hypothetical protein